MADRAALRPVRSAAFARLNVHAHIEGDLRRRSPSAADSAQGPRPCTADHGGDLLQRGVNVVSALLVGRLGAAELAAVGLSQLFLMFVMALVYGLGMGATLMGAFHTGARDVRQRTWAAGTVLVAGAAASVLLSSVGIFCSPTLARFMGPRDGSTIWPSCISGSPGTCSRATSFSME